MLEVGMSATLEHVVRREDLATHWKNDAEVLATPVLLWLAELACMAAIAKQIEPPMMTVGLGHAVQHLAPTPEGFRVTLQATLAEIDRRRLVFDVSATDGVEAVLKGRHERFMVDGEKFRAKVAQKKAEGPR